MRVNVYAEEMTDRVEIVSKEIDDQRFTGLRIYLELPATVDGKQYQGPFLHRDSDDDSAAVTFWGKRDLRTALRTALGLLDSHYAQQPTDITKLDDDARADELGVDRLVATMRAKLWAKRLEGYTGWNNDCTLEHLQQLLKNHVHKGDMVDVANLAMMIWNREHPNG